MTWWMRFDRFLTPRRMTYAWITGGILWFFWIISLLLGPGKMDLAGQVVGTDYLQFYAAGVTIRQAQSANLYNFDFQSQLEQQIAGPQLTSFHAFVNPPFLAWLFVPFSVLTYTWSFILWSLLSLGFLWLSLKLLSAEKTLPTFLWALTWFPIFAAISFGQNSLLSLLLFSLTFVLWRKEKYLLAGMVASLLLFKPQMVLGLGLLWLLEWRKGWKSLLGLCLGGGILAGLSFWQLPEASRAYLDLSKNFLPIMIYQKQFPLWHLHSLRGFWVMLFPGRLWLSQGLYLLCAAAGIVAFIYLWREKRKEKILIFAAAICLTVWITPHEMIYDWTILLAAALLLWRALPDQKVLMKALFALIWIVTFISGPLSYAQLQRLPFAVQISIPVLFVVYLYLYRNAMAVGVQNSAMVDVRTS
jgi:alpha-1,2-mannosyltransferase